MHEQQRMAPNYYAVLELEPGARPEAIEQAYRRLHEQLSSADLSGAAQELQGLVSERLASITAAYGVLSNPDLRAAYDAGLAAGAQSRQPGVREISAAPLAGRVRIQYKRSLIGLALLVLSVTAVLLISLREPQVAQPATNPEQQGAGTRLPAAVRDQITDPTLLEMLSRQEQQIARLTRSAPESRTVDDWVQLGNSIFDYVEAIRTYTGEGDAYRAVAAQWLDAAEAYSEALTLRPGDGTVRSDYAVSILRYGEIRGQAGFVQSAMMEAEQALRADPNGLRTLLNVGLVFAAARPARLDEARQLWTTIVNQAPGSQEGQAAKMLLQTTDP